MISIIRQNVITMPYLICTYLTLIYSFIYAVGKKLFSLCFYWLCHPRLSWSIILSPCWGFRPRFHRFGASRSVTQTENQPIGARQAGGRHFAFAAGQQGEPAVLLWPRRHGDRRMRKKWGHRGSRHAADDIGHDWPWPRGGHAGGGLAGVRRSDGLYTGGR